VVVVVMVVVVHVPGGWAQAIVAEVVHTSQDARADAALGSCSSCHIDERTAAIHVVAW
jgi:cytochrome c553